MPHKKTLYVTDLDGTLLTDKSGLKDRAAMMLNVYPKTGL